VLSEIGFTEEARRLLHRLNAVLLVAASAYHVVYLAVTRRGRFQVMALVPRFSDVRDAVVTMAYSLAAGATGPSTAASTTRRRPSTGRSSGHHRDEHHGA